MAPLSDYSTIYTTLKRTNEYVNALGQNDVPFYFDVGLLTKALEITWEKPVELQGIPCEGDMHLLMCIFAATVYHMVNCCLSPMCLLKAVCSKFSLAKTLKERSGNSNVWMEHYIIDSLFSSNVGVRRMAKSSLKTLTK